MQIEKAIKHFHFKLSKVWKATDTDIEAFSSIRDYVVVNNQKQINENQLFGKLYVFVYAQFLKKYNTTVFDEIPQKELNRMLSKPFDSFVESFTKQLNDSELYEMFEEIGIDLKHPALMSDSDKSKEKLIISDLSDDKIKKVLTPVWEVEDVKTNLIAMLNAVLNNIK